jgi:hypothetical protein
MPGPRLYPHQWSWDSALIAIGYSHYDQERAVQELRHLFESQWKNGLMPQIVFNPHFNNYFPGPNVWRAAESTHAPKDYETSDVVRPPVHATAALYVHRHAEDEAGVKEFLEYAFPKLKAWHEYLYRERVTLIAQPHPSWTQRYLAPSRVSSFRNVYSLRHLLLGQQKNTARSLETYEYRPSSTERG